MDRTTGTERLLRRRQQYQLLRAVLAGRDHQDARHGCPGHDDVHLPKDWVTLVHSYAAEADLRQHDPGALQDMMLDVAAALAIAAIERGRRHASATRITETTL
jgi:hypothetical protein